MRNSDQPWDMLKSLLVHLCEDASDLSNFLIPAEQIKDHLWPHVQPVLNRQLIQARGGETIVRIFADKFSVDAIVELFCDSFATDPVPWISTIPSICEVHQSPFVHRMSPLLLQLPLRQIPPKWLACVLRFGGNETCVQWLHALWNSRDFVSSDLIGAVCDFSLSVSRNDLTSPLLCFNLLVTLTIIHHANIEPIEAMVGLASLIESVLITKVPAGVPDEEYRVFLNGLSSRDGRKIRRFLKKFPNVVFSNNA
jgi:hypothetical protein